MRGQLPLVTVNDEVLSGYSRDVLRQAYDDLPVTATPEEFMAGHGNWSLSQAEYVLATRLAKLLTGRSLRDGPVEAAKPVECARLEAQFELVTSESAAIARRAIAEHGLDVALEKLNKDFGANLSLGPWLIASEDKQAFWCAGFGWTPSRLEASGFTDEEARTESLAARFGSYTRWIRFEDAFDYPREATGR